MSRGDRGSSKRAPPPKVHLVGKLDRWILGRYARILIKKLGWSMDERPRTDVDLNLFWPYLSINVRDRLPATKNAAFFTHLEETERNRSKNSKVNRWHYAAKTVDLRICMAEKYRKILEPHGPTVHVPVPIEVDRFKPRKLRVGVAGKVYALSRKGEGLVQRLVNTKEFEVVGAGKGWPCPTKFYSWKQMPGFYQSLDVFLVTSEVEGGPVTMLEAFSCGVRVVAPSDVGMVDEFDVATYRRGDFQSMLDRLRSFQIERITRSQSVANRTADNFAQACQDAIKL